jgi:hypothetical protein
MANGAYYKRSQNGLKQQLKNSFTHPMLVASI